MENIADILINSQVQAHIFHLRTDSYAIHKATQEYYEQITELFDRFAENYQSIYGLIEFEEAQSFTNSADIDTIKDYFTKLYDEIDAVPLQGIKDRTTDSILDDILELINATIYKITYLK